MTPTPRDAGFTLLEAMAALGIIAIVFGATYAGLGASGATVSRAEGILAATTRAESALRRIGADIPAAPGETVVEDGAWTATVEILAPPRTAAAANEALWADLGVRPLTARVRVVGPRGATVAIETLVLGDAS